MRRSAQCRQRGFASSLAQYAAASLVLAVLMFSLGASAATPYVRLHGERLHARNTDQVAQRHAELKVISSSSDSQAYTCSPQQAARQVAACKAFVMWDDSKCSAELYLEEVHDAFPSAAGKLFVNVGANKGGVIAKILQLWAPWRGSNNEHRLLDFWRTVEGVSESDAIGPCGKEDQARAPAPGKAHANRSMELAVTAHNSAWPRVVGVEMMTDTYEALKRGLRELGLDGGVHNHLGVRLEHRGITDQDVELMIRGIKPGQENLGEEYFQAEQAKLRALLAKAAGGDIHASEEAQAMKLRRLRMTTFDRLAQDCFLSDERLFLLVVDTEGNDPKVLDKAIATLKVHETPVIIFEYHSKWKRASPSHSLRKTLDSLEYIGYECFLVGKHGLWRLTNCWNDAWEFFRWSNVMCFLSKLERSQHIIANLDQAPRYAEPLSASR